MTGEFSPIAQWAGADKLVLSQISVEGHNGLTWSGAGVRTLAEEDIDHQEQRRETRRISVGVMIFGALAALSAIFRGVERFLNAIATVVGVTIMISILLWALVWAVAEIRSRHPSGRGR
ncbi:hypothetical protein [Pseudonocardia spinosispora]|uniref:hypothetical protein n=1 Tax=Pseudonocardia spinosispora TaxID=103441 RepID=UPI00049145FD|nr:hypothetical protein [Pseudonocardia spinosispora]